MKRLIVGLVVALVALLSSPSTSEAQSQVSIKIENGASCPVRVAVLQGESTLRTFAVDPIGSRQVTLNVPASAYVVRFGVIPGPGCTFRRYVVEQSSIQPRDTALLVHVNPNPFTSFVRRQGRL